MADDVRGTDAVEALIKRVAKARARQARYQHLMQDAYELAMPDREGWSQKAEGQDRAQRIYDSTAVVGVPRFANRLQQALFPPYQRWAQLEPTPGYKGVNDLPEQLEETTEIMFREIRASNFDNALNEAAHDLCAGTASILVENGKQHDPQGSTLRFQAFPVDRVALDEGPFGNIEGVFLRQTPRARDLTRLYPELRGKMPQALAAKERDAPDEEIPLDQCTIYEADKGRWCMKVLDPTGKTILAERYFRTSPWVIMRWSKAPGEVYGRGPLVQAMPDVRTANKTKELILQNAALAVAGVWGARDDGVLNPATVQIRPGMIIPMETTDGPQGPSLKRLEIGANFDVAQIVLQDLQTAIRQILFDNPLPPKVERGITATEIIERLSQFSQDTGAFGRLNSEGVVPLVMRILDVLDEAGVLPKALSRVRDLIARIVPVSPLAQAQNLADVRNVVDLLTVCLGLGEIGMQVARAAVNFDRLGQWLADMFKVPAQLRPDEDELAKERAEAEQAAEQEQMLSSPAVAQVAGAVARGAIPQASPKQGGQEQAA